MDSKRTLLSYQDRIAKKMIITGTKKTLSLSSDIDYFGRALKQESESWVSLFRFGNVEYLNLFL